MDTVTIKINKEVKKVAQKQARQAGVSLANLFASKITTFFTPTYSNNDYRPGEKFNAETAREIRQAMKDIEQGKNLSPAFKTVKEMKEYLMN